VSRALRVATALAVAAAVPALAYVLPIPGILHRLAEKRAELSLGSLEVTGTFQAEGQSADRVAAVTGLRAAGGKLLVPARFRLKVPGRCRLELEPPDAAEAARPFVSVREPKVTGAGLDGVPQAVALARGLCALLAASATEDGYAEALSRRGVALGTEASLGRFNGRIAFVLGGREQEKKPLAFVDKDGFQPLRVIYPEGGALEDVRLLDWASPTGGDWFPRAIEVWDGDALRLRFTTEKVVANPKLPDASY
jgi:hypothetical protein